MSHTFQGTIKKLFDEETFASGFNKRAFVVTESGDSKYPQDIKFECLKDKVDLLDDLREGETVTVKFDLKGNEWNGKYYVNLVAWKIESQSTGAKTERPSQASDQTPTPPEEDEDILDEEPPF